MEYGQKFRETCTGHSGREPGRKTAALFWLANRRGSVCLLYGPTEPILVSISIAKNIRFLTSLL